MSAPDPRGRRARVRTDRWGVRHIDAGSADEVFYAQGYVVATDRLFQVDLWRRRGLGLMSQAFGGEHLRHDAAARQFLYRGPMETEWAAYGASAQSAVHQFVAGLNARVTEVLEGRAPRPVEFEHYDYDPLPWDADDVVRIRRHGLFDNARSELQRARTLLAAGADAEDLRRVREPHDDLGAVDRHTLEKVFPGALRTYDLAREATAAWGDAGAALDSSADGSNSWVISGARSTTGRPILANDPHRAMTLPSLRYLVHLRCPQFDVIGAGEPMLPGVSLGHNAHVAFGLTILPTDQEDVYLYDLDGAGRYRYGGGWEDLQCVEETIPVRGDAPRSVELLFTRHGPVTGIRPDGAVACAVRAGWLEPGMAPYLGSLRYLAARSIEDVEDALSQWGAPSVNQVYADTSGRIGWHACGRVPARSWSGLLPVDGSGAFEWSGARPFTDLPGQRDPVEGWAATANEHRPSAAGTAPLGYEWMSPHRYRRIAEVLGASPLSSPADSADLQLDVFSQPAAAVLGLLEAALGPRDRVVDESSGLVVAALREWDLRADADSVGAGVFETWFRGPLLDALMEARATRLCPGDVEAALLALRPDPAGAVPHDPRPALAALEHLHRSDRTALRHLMMRTLNETQLQLSERYGPDPAEWALGQLQKTWFCHPAHPGAPQGWSLPPLPRGGTPDTVDVSGRDASWAHTVGASVRLVMDVGNWDASLAINAPGQSGDPSSPHFSDLAPLWARGGAFPLCFSDVAIDRHLESEHHVDVALAPASTSAENQVQ